MKSIDDLEALAIVTEWMEEHDGIFPSSTSSNKQEQHYYAILRRIQNTYNLIYTFLFTVKKRKFTKNKMGIIYLQINTWYNIVTRI